MSVCAAAPSPCLPLEKSANFVLKFRLIAETSNRLNVYPVFVTFRRFVYSAMRRIDGKAFRRQNVSAAKRFGDKTFRRQSVSAAKRFGGKTFRRQRFSPFRLHVVVGTGKLFGATRGSADRRPTLTAESPKSEKTGENRRNGDKIGTPGKCSKCPVLWCSTWNVDKLFHVERR